MVSFLLDARARPVFCTISIRIADLAVYLIQAYCFATLIIVALASTNIQMVMGVLPPGQPSRTH